MRILSRLLQQSEPLKLALVVRSDLRLSKGKAAAQCAHAAIACYERAARSQADVLRAWLSSGQPKIVLRCESLADLERLQRDARAAGVIEAAVMDAGRTQVAAGTVTVLGVGPGRQRDVDALVGQLKLL